MSEANSLVLAAMRDARKPDTTVPLCHASCPHDLAQRLGGDEILCTRPLGHADGVHAARGADGEPLLAWRGLKESE